MILQRYLDDVESSLRNSSPSRVVEYQGKVDEEALSRAFHLLCVHHPVLGGRIRVDGQGYLLYVPPGHFPELKVCNGDKGLMLREIRRPWDPAHAVAALTLIRDDGGGFVVMRVNHAVFDGTSWGAMFGELWRLYTDVVKGINIPVEPEPLPKSSYELLKQRWSEALSKRSPSISGPPNGVCSVLDRVISLSEEDTRRLIVAARNERLSVHTLVSGSLLASLRARAALREPVRMVCWSPVNLRNRVTPRVGATETTHFLGIHKAQMAVPADADAVVVGREIKTQLDSAIARRELSVDPLEMFSNVETSLEQHYAKAVVTNVGVLPALSHPPGLVITDMRSWSQTTSTPFPGYSISTYEGKLRIICLYPSSRFDDGEVDQLVKDTAGQLRRIVTSKST